MCFYRGLDGNYTRVVEVDLT